MWLCEDKFIKQCLNEKKINEKENKGKIIKEGLKNEQIIEMKFISQIFS